MKTVIETRDAPSAIGTYSQAIRVDNVVYLSGQIPINPVTGDVCEGDFRARVQQAFDNLKAVAIAAGGDFNDIAKLTIYLTDMACFPVVNEVMQGCWPMPYPARAVVAVAGLPKGVDIEMDAIIVTPR